MLSRNEFPDTDHAQQVVAEWCWYRYDTRRRHSSAVMMSPVTFETTAALEPGAAQGNLHDLGEPQYDLEEVLDFEDEGPPRAAPAGGLDPLTGRLGR